MKEIIERAEKLGYKCYFDDKIHNHIYSIDPISEEMCYIELCLIQKWIYENFNIIIEINVCRDNKFRFKIIGKYKDGSILMPLKGSFDALEEGIKKALEILEK